jgi:hypothetical protein
VPDGWPDGAGRDARRGLDGVPVPDGGPEGLPDGVPDGGQMGCPTGGQTGCPTGARRVARRGGQTGCPTGGQTGWPDGVPDRGQTEGPTGQTGWRTEGLFTFKRKYDMFYIRVM